MGTLIAVFATLMIVLGAAAWESGFTRDKNEADSGHKFLLSSPKRILGAIGFFTMGFILLGEAASIGGRLDRSVGEWIRDPDTGDFTTIARILAVVIVVVAAEYVARFSGRLSIPEQRATRTQAHQ